MLAVKNLQVKLAEKLILNRLNLLVKPGELVAVMGPNGSGKSTLAYTLAGHPGYPVSGGSITLNRQKINHLSPDQRAKKGIFLALQYPIAVAGVDVFNLLRQAYGAVKKNRLTLFEFKQLMAKETKRLKLPAGFINRSINDGFSGGEKKKSEILQLAVLKPKLAILDEIDSGLDIDAVKTVAAAINRIRRDNPRLGLIVITHYRRILDYLTVNRVVVLKAGKVVKEGDNRLVGQLEKCGYAGI